MALAAVTNDGYNIIYLDASVFKDPTMAKAISYAAAFSNPLSLQWLSPEYKDDKALVLSLVSKNGMALKYASYRLRQDRDVVQAAIDQNPMALQYAFKTLRDTIHAPRHRSFQDEIEIHPTSYPL